METKHQYPLTFTPVVESDAIYGGDYATMEVNVVSGEWVSVEDYDKLNFKYHHVLSKLERLLSTLESQVKSLDQTLYGELYGN